MATRSDAIQTARALDARGSDFNTIVDLLVERLEVGPEAARGIAAQVCKPRGRSAAPALNLRRPASP